MIARNLLFVDDRSKRIHQALRKYSGFRVCIAPNVPEALRMLSRYEWDIVSLDYDLNGRDFCFPASEDCGMEIIRYLERTEWPSHLKLPDFIIHSSNAFGAEMMYKRLKALYPQANIFKTPFTLWGPGG